MSHVNVRAGLFIGLAFWLTASAASAQAGGLVFGAGGGATVYCIDTRCDGGTILGLSSGFLLTPAVGVEFSGRSHRCFDCDRFLIGDVAILIQYPRGRIRPYAGGGVGYSSDPGFMGSHLGLLATVGAFAPLTDPWGLRADVRGRRVGSGSMGEFTLWIHYRTSKR